MLKKKVNVNGIVICVIEVIVAVLLIVNPVAFTNAIVMVAGGGLLVVGIVNIVKYFKAEPEVAANGRSLMLGLGTLVAGLFCLLKHSWIVATLSLLTVIYGVFIFVCGLEKVQTTVDLFRTKKGKWIFPALGAAISIICAVIIICNPFRTAAVVWMFIGITLLVQAVFDIMVLVVKNKAQ